MFHVPWEGGWVANNTFSWGLTGVGTPQQRSTSRTSSVTATATSTAQSQVPNFNASAGAPLPSHSLCQMKGCQHSSSEKRNDNRTTTGHIFAVVFPGSSFKIHIGTHHREIVVLAQFTPRPSVFLLLSAAHPTTMLPLLNSDAWDPSWLAK